MDKISVCVVDDIAEIREVLTDVVNSNADLDCIAAIASPDEALLLLPQLQPQVVLMDINLGGTVSGIDCVRMLKEKMPAIGFIMCTVFDDDNKIFDALSAGASGYMVKKTPPTEMHKAIKDMAAGGAPMSSSIARKVVESFNKNTPVVKDEKFMLSPREIEILEKVAKGMRYREVGAELFVSPETVRKHLYNIYEKLHVKNKMEAVNKFFGRQ